ncbi:Methylthioribose-1-phosphate isomerase, partial [Fragariocoptes setiger]
MMTLEAIKFDEQTRSLSILDQTLLPSSFEYIDIKTCIDGHRAIKDMQVRGAPAIAAVACLSIVAELNHMSQTDSDSSLEFIKNRSEFLSTARPTAVNLRAALRALVSYSEKISMESEVREFIDKITELCVTAFKNGINLNMSLGDFGAELLMSRDLNVDRSVTVLTHCNTGALATVGYGTALGVVRSLRKKGVLGHAYCTETRPYNQGSRLTAYEFLHEGIPATLICDSFVTYLMASRKIDAVVVGADCVAGNGDTANKIGTYQIAVVSKHFGVPFFVAAPTQSIDLTMINGREIKIEQRPAREMKFVGETMIAPEGIDVWNPGFDVTPAELISAIITEFGCYEPSKLKKELDGKRGEDKGDTRCSFSY